MLFHFRNILTEVKHIFVEESSIAAHSDMHLLYCQTKAETLVSIGDPLQLQPYRSRNLRQFPRYNVIPLADHLEYHAPYAVVQLTTVYRSHPEIVKAVSYATYEITDEPLDTPITAEERANITNSLVPLACKNYPILLVQCQGESVVQATYFRCNATQCDVAVEILKQIGRLTNNLSVVITAYYTGDVKYIRAKIEEERTLPRLKENYNSFSNIEVTTVNAYIGGEAQVNILVTNVTQPNPDRDEEDRENDWLEFETPVFIFDNYVGTVAISRGSDLVIVIGQMDYLTSISPEPQVQEQDQPDQEAAEQGPTLQPGQVLSRFLHFAADRAPVLNYSHYLQRIKDASQQSLTRYDPQGIIQEPTANRGIVQTCQLNNHCSWYDRLNLNRPGKGTVPAPQGV